MNGQKAKQARFSLAIAMRELYRVSNNFLYASHIMQGLLFVTNIYLILSKAEDSSGQVWTILALSVLILSTCAFLQDKSRAFYGLGESVRKLDMLERIFPRATMNASKHYLLLKIPDAVLAKATENSEQKTDYLSKQSEKYKILIENIQQNCYFTSEIMRSYAGIIRAVIILMVAVFAISIFFGLYFLSTSNIDSNLSKGISGYLAVLVNFIFALNIFEHLSSFRRKSSALKKIDENLDHIKKNPHEDEVIASFTDYNCTLSDAFPCPDFVYNRIESRLNTIWANRVKNA